MRGMPTRAAKEPAAPLSLDLTFAFDRALGPGRGIPRERFESLVSETPAILAATASDRAAGRLPFMDLPFRKDVVEGIEAFAAARRRDTTDVVLVGIGGSSRTAQVLDETRRPPRGRVDRRPRLHVLDTVDPTRVEDLLRGLPPRTTTVVVVSKAGTTLEVWAGFLAVEAWLTKALGARRAAARVAAVAGEEENPLRARALARGYALFAVPQGVGGRFSGLSAVGLLPAALLGIPVERVRAGARAAAARCERPLPRENPALSLAVLHRAAERGGWSAVVLLPYAEALRPFGAWWEQLVAESIGKKGARGAAGVAPLPGVGPSDQHSLLQLLIDGPEYRFTLFVEVSSLARAKVRVPGNAGGDVSPAAGRPFGTILAAEREATELALAEAGRPSATLRLEDAGPASLGALLYTYEVAVMWWGRLASVDPFDQPAVERGKVVTLASLTGEPTSAAEALARHRAVPRTVAR
jgi:glucose-6-phosphate isomerase